MTDLPLFVDAETLHGAMDAPDLQLVAVDAPEDFARTHIPGATRIAMADLMATVPPTGGLLPDDATLAQLFSNAGLRNDAHIVAYDRAGDGQAARLLYTLDAMGHSAFSLLDGGLAAWDQAGFELESGAAPPDISDFKVRRQSDRIADRDWIEQRLGDAKPLDTRSAAEYRGDDVRSARGGHIPGAINLDWEMLKDPNGRLRARAELEQLFADRGLQPGDEIAAYCQTHVRSSYVYLVLKMLGFDNIRGYPGAWSDWGNRDDTPVVTGDRPDS